MGFRSGAGVTQPRRRSSLVVGLGLTVDDVDVDLLAQMQSPPEDLSQLQQIRLLRRTAGKTFTSGAAGLDEGTSLDVERGR